MKALVFFIIMMGLISLLPFSVFSQLFSLDLDDYLSRLADNSCRGIALDSSGCIYVTGYTRSAEFPRRNAFQSRKEGREDAFVAKFSSSGSTLIYSTYLGGGNREKGEGIAVDHFQCPVIVGMTDSSDFPCHNAYQPKLAGRLDAFIARFDSSGSALVYSTYLGGSRDDAAFDIALDGDGNAYLGGETISPDFPTDNSFQSSKGSWEQDVFVAKLTSSGSGIIYSTYLGGKGVDFGGHIALDRDRQIYITGTTWSDDFPTRDCYSPARAGKYDVFVGKLSSSGSSLLYSTYLGGEGIDFGNDITVDQSGAAYIAGFTIGGGFPLLNSFWMHDDEEGDAFISILSPTGSVLLLSACFGTEGIETGLGVVLDSNKNVYLTGTSNNAQFPLRNPFQAEWGGDEDLFLIKLSPGGGNVIYSSYLGGDEYERPYGIAIRSSGNVLIAGCTYSYNFPLKSPIQAAMPGLSAGFISEISYSGSSLLFSTFLGGTSPLTRIIHEN